MVQSTVDRGKIGGVVTLYKMSVRRCQGAHSGINISPQSSNPRHITAMLLQEKQVVETSN